ncbi:unnamed protein product [Blumeria hordei]|uniref:Uncharacterized protein n=1 Tax=Blumeria hordei TaxID=2867405 RepID=A0A383UJL0_BLUHO|nr:unnamed protein product [Blumeria hordei]
MLFTHLKKTPLLLIFIQVMLISVVFGLGTGNKGTFVCGAKSHPRSKVERLVQKFATKLKPLGEEARKPFLYKGNLLGIMTRENGPYYQKQIVGLRSRFTSKSSNKSFIILDKDRVLAAVAFNSGGNTFTKCSTKLGKGSAVV